MLTCKSSNRRGLLRGAWKSLQPANSGRGLVVASRGDEDGDGDSPGLVRSTAASPMGDLLDVSCLHVVMKTVMEIALAASAEAMFARVRREDAATRI